MKKTLKLFILLCAALFTYTMAGCNEKGSNSNTNTVVETNKDIQLDMFDIKAVEEKFEKEVTWEIENKKIVSVENNTFVAQGLEGTTTVYARTETEVIKYNVSVVDSGQRPAITEIEDITMYTNKTFDLMKSLKVKYGEVELKGIKYGFSSVGDAVTVDKNGVITGVSEGIAKVSITAEYMGYKTTKRTINVTVNLDTAIVLKDSEIKLSIVKGDIDPVEYDIVAEVVVEGEKVDNATINANILSGNEFISLSGLKIKALKCGDAVVQLTYQNGDKKVSSNLEVTVHDDTVNYKPGALIANDTTVLDDGTNRVDFKKVTDTESEFYNCYKFTVKSGPKKEFWDNLYFDTACLNTIIKEGYKAFSYDVYVTSEEFSFGGCIPAALVDEITGANFNRYNFGATDGVYTEDMELVNIYDGDNRVATGQKLSVNHWYKIVCDMTTFSEGWSILGLSFDARDFEQSAYFTNFKYHTTTSLLLNGGYDANHTGVGDDDPNLTDEKDEFLNSITYNNSFLTVKKVISGDYKDSYKIRSSSSAYANRISLNYVEADNTPGEFFTTKKHYIKFEACLIEGNAISVCNWLKAVKENGEDLKVEGSLTTSTGLETFKVYNSSGKESNLSMGSWVTIVVELSYGDAPEWAMFWFGLTGSKYKPAVAYVRNFEYLEEAPVIEEEKNDILEMFYSFPEGKAQLENVGSIEERTDVYKVSCPTWYPDIVAFTGMGEGYKGKVIMFDFKLLNENSALMLAVDWKNSHDGALANDIALYDKDGNKINLGDAVANVWYTIVIDLSGTESAPNFMSVYNKDGSNNAFMYIDNARVATENPYKK